ncbi:MAG: hypothetical protein RSK76_03945 [Clostridia bacterium]
MKRVLLFLLVMTMVLGSVPAAMAAEAQPEAKVSKVNARITAYTGYLKELFDDTDKGRISHVGIADINKDYQPELFYILREKSGLSQFHFCRYEAEEVAEYDIETNYIGINPTGIGLERRNRKGTSEHCWVLTSSGKNPNKYSEKLWNIFDRADSSLNNEVKFRRAWKKNANRYFIDEEETVKSAYIDELDCFERTWPLASDRHYRNRGFIRKVSSPRSWTSVRRALSYAANAWMAS